MPFFAVSLMLASIAAGAYPQHAGGQFVADAFGKTPEIRTVLASPDGSVPPPLAGASSRESNRRGGRGDGPRDVGVCPRAGCENSLATLGDPNVLVLWDAKNLGKNAQRAARKDRLFRAGDRSENVPLGGESVPYIRGTDQLMVQCRGRR